MSITPSLDDQDLANKLKLTGSEGLNLINHFKSSYCF